jgi:pteridine reductase
MTDDNLGLQGKRALVTGAGTRLGQAIAIALGAHKMHVVVHYHTNHDGAQHSAQTIAASGGQAHVLPADLTSRDAARALVDSAVELLGGLDLLVANAASFEEISLDQIDDQAWDRSLSLNLASPFALAHRAIAALRQSQGNIVFVTCSSVDAPFRGHLPYVVSKGGLYQAMRTLAIELAPAVRVNAVAPGAVLLPREWPEPTAERIVRQIPLRRVGSPEDVAHAVVFLASSPFVTGQQIAVDGGRSLAPIADSG